MIHSRPGFRPRTSDDAPAKLNDDMIPAINRKALKETSGVNETLQAKADTAAAAINAQALAEAQILAAQGGDIIVNHNPSATPHINEPGI